MDWHAAPSCATLPLLMNRSAVEAGGKTRRVREVNTEDGYKFTLDDGTWIMMRPSGTEPKVRTYAETRESAEASAALCEAAKALALEAIHGKP